MFRAKMTIGIAIGLLLLAARPVWAVDIEFSAFGDMSLGFSFGDPADKEAAALFEQFGTDPNPVNLQRGFGIAGTDFVVVAELTDRLSFLSEVNLQLERGGTTEIGLDMERNFLDYRITDWFNIQVGSFFTPIGFQNRTLYSRAWLMTSIQVPDFTEEELGLIPTHEVGVNFHGNVPTFGAHAMNYAFSVTNGRGVDPVGLVLGRDPSNNKQVTAMLEWVIPDFRDFRIGLSGWTGKINTFNVTTTPLGDPVSVDTLEPLELREIGFNPHMVLYSKPFNLIVEYAFAQHEDLSGDLGGEKFKFSALFAELSLNLMRGKLHPYVRYDVTRLPSDGGPYYPLRGEGGFLTRHFIPEFEAVMIGAAYDLYAHNRIKVEYIHHLEGPRPEHGIVIQTAFGF